jgi:YVTN family beta-propeller protein
LLVLLLCRLVDTAHAQPSWGRPTYSSPIAINPNDRLIWVVNPSDDSVSVIRPDNNTRLAKINVGDEPQSITLTPDNQFAYVANAAGNSVTVIQINDPAWGTFSANVISNFVTGAEPWNIVVSPDGRRVFVANSQQDTITVINTANRAIIGHVPLRVDPFANHIQPRGLAVTADSSKALRDAAFSLSPGPAAGKVMIWANRVWSMCSISTPVPQPLLDYRLARTCRAGAADHRLQVSKSDQSARARHRRVSESTSERGHPR